MVRSHGKDLPLLNDSQLLNNQSNRKYTRERIRMSEIKDLFFPKDNFVLRFYKENDEWVVRLDDQTFQFFQNMLNEDKKDA